MQNKYLLSIDYGTQSVRALVFDQHGQLIAKAQRPVISYHSQKPHYAEQETEYCWQQVCDVVQALWRDSNLTPDQICGLSVTTQRNCVLHLDQNNRPLRPMFMWPDDRRATYLPRLAWWWKVAFSFVGMNSRIGYFQGQSEINWVAQHQPDIATGAAKVGFLSSFINYKMTDNLIDSVASQVGYLPFDYKRRRWCHALAWQWQAIDVKPAQMVDVIEPGELIGSITAEAAKATGLLEGTPLVAAGADKACETLTANAASANVASVSLGTAATISITQRRYKEAFRYLPAYPALTEASFINEIILQRGFWLFSHFIEQYGAEDRAQAKKLGISVEQYICGQLPDIMPGSDGLTLQPFWSPGVIYPGPEAKGSILGFTPAHTRLHLYRALIEGILFALKQGLTRLKRIAPQPIKVIRISGGGSQSDVVMQMAADIFNLPCERVQTYETSGLGAAIACAKGVGLYHSIAKGAKDMVKIGDRFEPSDDAKAYQQIYTEKAQPLYRYLKPFYKKY